MSLRFREQTLHIRHLGHSFGVENDGACMLPSRMLKREGKQPAIKSNLTIIIRLQFEGEREGELSDNMRP